MDIIPKLFVGRALFIRFCRELHGLSFGKKSNIPGSMISEAVFCEFPSGTLRKDVASALNMLENARNPVQ
jgi:hypothetical protein